MALELEAFIKPEIGRGDTAITRMLSVENEVSVSGVFWDVYFG